MIDALLVTAILLLLLVIALLVVVLSRRVVLDPALFQPLLAAVAGVQEKTERVVREEIARNREEAAATAQLARTELSQTLLSLSESLAQRIQTLTQTNDQRLDQMRGEAAATGKTLRDELGTTLKAFNDSVIQGMTGLAKVQHEQLEAFSGQLARLTEGNLLKLEEVKKAVEEKLKSIQEDNAKQLDQMRATVDEKLQGTLEKRLGESFKLVSERLELVHKGLGEMQVLATGVGDLKKVLTNVKSRGTWGEVQLGAMLEQVLTPEQYDMNVATKETGERVEFALRLPGGGGGASGAGEKNDILWLPIDSKWPEEDYHRLLDAQEKADPEAAEVAWKQLETRIRAEAKDICQKYINPPKTTDFAIMFLPTEGLFVEVVRRSGLATQIQQDCHVVIAGPTTLWAILNSLQMGFRTLAIQKRSSEVWNLLAAVKTEWGKYGDVLAKVQKKLQEASNTVDDVAKRSRVIGRKLRDVQELPVGTQPELLLDVASVPAEDDSE